MVNCRSVDGMLANEGGTVAPPVGFNVLGGTAAENRSTGERASANA